LSVTVRVLGWIYAVAYFWLAYRRAYDTTLLGALWRATLVLVGYWFVLLVTLIAIWIPTLIAAFSRA
jgi:hypothetical protein